MQPTRHVALTSPNRAAAKHRVPLYPFILDGVASNADLIQDDGEHPNPQGVRVMVERMLPAVETALRTGKR